MNQSSFSKQLVSILLIAFSFSCENSSDPLYPPIQFTQIAPMLDTGRSSAVAFAIAGKGYVALGRNQAGTQLKDCWQYDPTSNSWSEKAEFSGIARVKATANVLNGKAYVGLGFNINYGVYNDSACLKDFWVYEPLDDKWTQLANLPSNATDACVSFVFNNSIYIGAGFNGANFTNEFWKYDPQQNTWTRLNDFPGLPRAGAVACSNGNQVFFGTGYRTVNENDLWEYLPLTDTWKKLKPMLATGRVNAVALSINNRYFVSAGRHFGGTLTGGKALSDILEYDAQHNEWHKRGSIPDEGNRENAVAFTINGKGYIGLGENDITVLNDFWSFVP